MAFGRVYCFGPTFRAEKSKTRRHLTEFWMIEPEVAFLELPGLLELAEEFVSYVVGRALDRCRESLKVLERDTTQLEKVVPPFPRITYDEAATRLETAEAQAKMKEAGAPAFARGSDFGSFDETLLTQQFDRPVMVTHWPADDQGVLHAARSRRTRRRRSASTSWPPKATERSSAARSASTTTICS